MWQDSGWRHRQVALTVRCCCQSKFARSESGRNLNITCSSDVYDIDRMQLPSISVLPKARSFV